MNADLRDYVLSLPLDVRQSLASIDEPCWYVSGYEDKRVPAACEVQAHPSVITNYGRPTFGHVAAYVPISPVAIALHAAKLLGAIGHTVETFADRTTVSAWRRTDQIKPGEKLMISGYADNDPTGHRAAIALLVKVMQCAA